MNDRHQRFLRIAQRAALKTVDMKRQFSTVIVDKNRTIVVARNMRSHTMTPNVVCPQTGKRYYGLHAEVHALLKCDFSVEGMTAYVHGQNVKTGKKVYSKPCTLCESFLRKRKIKTVVFSTQTGYEVWELE